MRTGVSCFAWFAVMSLSFCILANVEGQTQSGKSDPWKQLTGKWKCEGAWVHGQAMPKQVVAKMQLEMSKGKFVAQTMVGQQKGELAFVGKPSNKKLKISTVIPDRLGGQPKKSTMNCMYKFEKGVLVIVYSSDEKFPTEFKSTESNKYLLVHYRKVASTKTDSKKK